MFEISDSVTRKIFWSPSGEVALWFKGSMYVWLLIAIGILAYGIAKRARLWKLGKPEACFDQPVKRILFVLRYALGQAKVLRQRKERDPKPKSLYAAILHGSIFYGFCALAFGTTIVAFEDYGILRIYHGWFYVFVTIVCELGGLALTLGLGLGVLRRTVEKKRFPHANDYTIVYLFLFVLSLQGFLLEASRLAFQENPVDEKWSFIGSAIARLFPAGISVEGQENIYSSLWYMHMLTTMGFFAFIPYSRMMHVVTSVLNLYTMRLEPTVKMEKMDFENAEAEYFGNKFIKDFTFKDILSFDSCTECRRCTDICPANGVGKILDPREIMLKLRDSMLIENQLKEGNIAEGLYESGMINKEEIWACTNCGACVGECPVGIDQLRSIMQLRRYQTLSLGEVPASAGKAIENIKQHKNPWGISVEDRFKWAEGLEIPLITGDTPEVEWLYYVGCAGSYDPNNQKVARSVVTILQQCKVDFAVMGKGENCTGEPAKRLGDEYSFAEIAVSNVEQLKSLKFKKIVTHCPHCFNTLKNDYPDYGGVYQVFHHTQLLSQLHKDGKLKLPGEMRKTVTFHDPCFLGRHNEEYEAPRQLLNAVAGLRLVEMQQSKKTSSCCGMGGGNMWYESEGGAKTIVEQRLEHVAQTKAKTLVTGCSFCMINFKSAFAKNEATKDLEIVDVAQVVADALR